MRLDAEFSADEFEVRLCSHHEMMRVGCPIRHMEASFASQPMVTSKQAIRGLDNLGKLYSVPIAEWSLRCDSREFSASESRRCSLIG